MPDLGKHRQRLTVLVLVIASAGLWAASRLGWVQVRTADDLRGVRVSTLSGETWTAGLVPLALVVLAAVAATLALKGLALRILAVVLVLVGVAAAFPAVQLLVGGASTEHAARLVNPPALTAQATTTSAVAGPLLALLGALLTLVAAGLLLGTPKAARGLPSRYQSPAVLKEEAEASAAGPVDEDVTERLLWAALDAGHDPTAEHPAGDPDHHPDSLGVDQAADTTRGARGSHECS